MMLALTKTLVARPCFGAPVSATALLLLFATLLHAGNPAFVSLEPISPNAAYSTRYDLALTI